MKNETPAGDFSTGEMYMDIRGSDQTLSVSAGNGMTETLTYNLSAWSLTAARRLLYLFSFWRAWQLSFSLFFLLFFFFQLLLWNRIPVTSCFCSMSCSCPQSFGPMSDWLGWCSVFQLPVHRLGNQLNSDCRCNILYKIDSTWETNKDGVCIGVPPLFEFKFKVPVQSSMI